MPLAFLLGDYFAVYYTIHFIASYSKSYTTQTNYHKILNIKQTHHIETIDETSLLTNFLQITCKHEGFPSIAIDKVLEVQVLLNLSQAF